jgi:DNA-binding transcriptional MocR family regulator
MMAGPLVAALRWVRQGHFLRVESSRHKLYNNRRAAVHTLIDEYFPSLPRGQFTGKHMHITQETRDKVRDRSFKGKKPNHHDSDPLDINATTEAW